MSQDNLSNDPQSGKNKKQSDYARYSGIGMQMLLTILAGVFLGRKLDEWLNTKFPIFTLLLILAAVALAMYMVIKEFGKPK